MADNISQYKKMTATPVTRLVLTLALPTTISMLITNIYNMADTFFVSSLGTSASGAIGIVFGLQAIMQAFGFMYGHGAGSSVSRLLGSGDSDKATIYTSSSFFMALFSGGLITLLGLIFLTPLMKILGSTDTILPYARQYGKYVLMAAPFITSSCVLNNILRYEGKAFLAMFGLTAGGILNIILDPIFIFGFHMGTSGAGLSTMLSQIISFMILLYMFLSGKTVSKLKISKASRKILVYGSIVYVGLASMIRQGLSAISTMLLNHQAALHGGDAAVSAMSITNRVIFLVFAVALGVGQGFQPVAAFNYGAGKKDRVRLAYRVTLLFGVIFISVLGIFAFIFAKNIMTWFIKDPEVISIGIYAIRFASVALVAQPFSVSSNMLFQSLGKGGRAAFLSSLRSGLFFIPLIILLPGLMGVTGVELSQPIADILSGLVSFPMALVFIRKELCIDKD